jgi:hypothetical protein
MRLEGPFTRIIFLKNRTTPEIQALEIEAKPWQITYRRSSAPARPKPAPK